MSADRFQDFETSAGWQRTVAEDLIAGHASIVAEFVDQGFTRSRGWARRPEAARGFDAEAAENGAHPEAAHRPLNSKDITRKSSDVD